jgi:hypothetical protein
MEKNVLPQSNRLFVNSSWRPAGASLFPRCRLRLPARAGSSACKQGLSRPARPKLSQRRRGFPLDASGSGATHLASFLSQPFPSLADVDLIFRLRSGCGGNFAKVCNFGSKPLHQISQKLRPIDSNFREVGGRRIKPCFCFLLLLHCQQRIP